MSERTSRSMAVRTEECRIARLIIGGSRALRGGSSLLYDSEDAEVEETNPPNMLIVDSIAQSNLLEYCGLINCDPLMKVQRLSVSVDPHPFQTADRDQPFIADADRRLT